MAKRYNKPKKGDEKARAREGEEISRWLMSSALMSRAVTDLLIEKGVLTHDEIDRKLGELTGEGHSHEHD